MCYQFGSSTTVALTFVDLFDAEGRHHGLEKMRRAQGKVERRGRGKVNAVVCGGDGTVLWVVSLVGEHGIDLTKIVFCIIPIGTGNDFSRCLGWGGSPISFSEGNLNNLKVRLLEWLEGE
jgi:diacylglycerol kinase family enzyme